MQCLAEKVDRVREGAAKAVGQRDQTVAHRPRTERCQLRARQVSVIENLPDQVGIAVFEGGFVQQHTLFITHPNDFVGQMDVCFVAYTRDGMISRAYEYFDTGQIEKFLGPRPTA